MLNTSFKLFILFISIPLYAKTYICVSEHGASVIEVNGTAVSIGYGYAKEEQWLINKTGVQFFNDDKLILDKCDFSESDEQMLIKCSKVDEFPTDENFFRLNGLDKNYLIGFGKCNELE